MTGRLIVMGSGETSPTMVSVHREAFAALGDGARAVLLDTPYGFQENADELTERAQEYFRVSVDREIEPATFRSNDSVYERELMLDMVRNASFVFSGPGSPTYALEQWRPTRLGELLVDTLETGGVVTFASAAALTLGRFTIPVYEIYKVGRPPFWAEGLDVLGAIGYPCAVVPHFDNAEGGTHDTRFCWMGKRRFDLLRGLLPPDVPAVGIDEHTAWIVDFDRREFTVAGRGTVTIVRPAGSDVYGVGEVVPLTELAPGATAGESEEGAGPPAPSPHDFATTMATGDAGDVIESIVTELEFGEVAVAQSMVVRLRDALDRGMEEREQAIGPLVSIIVDARERARRDGRWSEADELRDRLADAGIAVVDTPDGPQWELQE